MHRHRAIVDAFRRSGYDNGKDSPPMSVFLQASPGRALSALAAAAMLLACGGAAARESRADIRIVRIDAAQMHGAYDAADPSQASLAKACKAWTLRPQQAVQFFRLAKQYPQGRGDDFYWLPCSIKGQLIASDGVWDFEIDAAATGSWRRGDIVRQWGCRDRRCKALVLLMPDDGAP
jgi:hypothetical protein